MIGPYAEVVRTGVREEFDGRMVPVFAWQGPATAPAWVDSLALERDLYPWPLKRLVDDSWFTRRVLVVRQDVPLWRLSGLYWAARWRSRRAVRTFNARLIWTCVIWGLGKERMGEEPHWGWVFRRSQTR